MTLIDILLGTPWWVYAIFTYLMIIGIKSLQDHKVLLYRLLIVPVIFVGWSIYSISVRYGLKPLFVSVWLLTFVIGIVLGWLLLYRGIKVDKKTLTAHIPGSWFPLVCYVLFFSIKYFIGFTYALSPETKGMAIFWLTDIVSSGILSGMFNGRIFHIMRQYWK